MPDLGRNWPVYSTIQSIGPTPASMGVNVGSMVTRSDPMSMNYFIGQLAGGFELEFGRLARAKGYDVNFLTASQRRNLRIDAFNGLKPTSPYVIVVSAHPPSINIAGTYVGLFDVSIVSVDGVEKVWQASIHVSRYAKTTAHEEAGRALAGEMIDLLDKALGESVLRQKGSG